MYNLMGPVLSFKNYRGGGGGGGGAPSASSIFYSVKLCILLQNDAIFYLRVSLHDPLFGSNYSFGIVLAYE